MDSRAGQSPARASQQVGSVAAGEPVGRAGCAKKVPRVAGLC